MVTFYRFSNFFLLFLIFLKCEKTQSNPCPNQEYSVYNVGHRRCYRVITFARTFDASKDHCVSLGMFLEENPNSADRRLISDLIRSEFGRSYQYWLKKELSPDGEGIICKTLTARYPVIYPCNGYLPFVCVLQLPQVHVEMTFDNRHITMDLMEELLHENSTEVILKLSEINSIDNSTAIPIEEKIKHISVHYCEGNWKLFSINNYCYKMFRLQPNGNVEDAKKACDNLNSTLVLSKDEDEKQFLESLIVSESSELSPRVEKRQAQADQCVHFQRTDGVFVPPLHNINCVSLEQYFYCRQKSFLKDISVE